MFNEVLVHMEPNDDKASLISRLADDYERGEGECFSSKLAIKDRSKKSPRKNLAPIFLNLQQLSSLTCKF
jgi:hypothetical protein